MVSGLEAKHESSASKDGEGSRMALDALDDGLDPFHGHKRHSMVDGSVAGLQRGLGLDSDEATTVGTLAARLAKDPCL